MNVPSDRQLLDLARRVGEYLAARGFSVATAESCTGGWVGKTLTDIPGSSGWFLEGYITYSNKGKQRTLGVSGALLKRSGAVSQATARAMARGALHRAGVDVAVAITGIAGPGGAVPGKPVGTVWFAWATRRGRSTATKTVRKRFRGDREAVRRQAVQTALAGLIAR